MLEGFKGEPEEDDGVEEAVQTMGPEDLQNRGQKDGGGRKGEGVGWEAGDSKKGEQRRETVRKKGKSIKKRGVLGAPVFQVTPDLDLLCQPSARLSGGFVRASPLNCHPADRHVVYSLCVMGRREAAECVYEQ